MSKFLLLLGPSGVGKSTIIQKLITLDKRFIYISPYTTRPIRDGETDKIFINEEGINEMEKKGEILTVNHLYNIKYVTPKIPIIEALLFGFFPILDWPISRIEIMFEFFPGQLYLVYVAPPSIEILEKRIKKDGRDLDGSRLEKARQELQYYWSGAYSSLIDLSVVSEENKSTHVVDLIYSSYLKSFP